MKIAIVILSISLVLALAAAFGASVIAVRAINTVKADHQRAEKAEIEEATRGLCAKSGEAATNAYRVRAYGASESEALNMLPPIANPIAEAALHHAISFAYTWPAPTGNPVSDFNASHSVSHAAYEACMNAAKVAK